MRLMLVLLSTPCDCNACFTCDGVELNSTLSELELLPVEVLAGPPTLASSLLLDVELLLLEEVERGSGIIPRNLPSCLSVLSPRTFPSPFWIIFPLSG